ncbi:hypothetical protein FN976_28485 [Caenimonas sedimenti]|uniref:Uncharacterized protein n=1 Tax=Caenimonas sedimenti TaxID=2596921 RepID=A0A562ZDF7_9BURK|nr:hypothetical protein [Caenimonas sedimenti]TWO63580.1 hypothetical protein FN976_28485 [Caenimonas sedimenti]
MNAEAREQAGVVTPEPPPSETLALRPSHELLKVPPERAEPVTPVPAAASSAPVAAPVAAHAQTQVPATPRPAPVAAAANAQTGTDGLDARPQVQVQFHPHSLTWVTGGLALLAGFGWVIERRRRRLLETDKDSVFWANAHQSGASIITTAGGLNDILPDSPDPAEAARAIYVTAIGETNSRREATLIDLHQLKGKLKRRRERGDNVAALLLLQQHLVDFRYTSPWVFLELLELYKVLDRQMEWEIARDAFKQRFGQNAPTWAAPSTEDTQLVEDRQLSEELALHWPYRESRMFILRWVLGDPTMRLKNSGPPLLGLGIYRDLMLLDSILDDVVVVRTQPADSLL